MADISMCRNEDCPLQESCYRFTAQASMIQEYIAFRWEMIDGNPACVDYWPYPEKLMIPKKWKER